MKICPNCHKENSDDYGFCIKCGADIRATPPVSATAYSPPAPAAGPVNGRFRLLEESLASAEGECEVRTYHCTSFKSSLLSLRAEGYLVVTNKRVVFHAFGTSFAGRSILQSEVPVEDVSGISMYKGTYFSLAHLFAAFLFSNIVGAAVNGFLAAIIYSMARSAAENLSLSNLETLPSTLGTLQTTLQILLWLLAVGSLLISFILRKENILRSALAATSVLALGELGGLSYLTGAIGNYLNNEQRTGASGFILFLAMVVGIYALVCFFWYARRPTMSLAVGSKGGSSTPIAISGVSSFGIYNTAASKALSAEPAEDAEPLVKELGAMIMDIQALGEIGVQQWRAA